MTLNSYDNLVSQSTVVVLFVVLYITATFFCFSEKNHFPLRMKPNKAKESKVEEKAKSSETEKKREFEQLYVRTGKVGRAKNGFWNCKPKGWPFFSCFVLSQTMI